MEHHFQQGKRCHPTPTGVNHKQALGRASWRCHKPWAGQAGGATSSGWGNGGVATSYGQSNRGGVPQVMGGASREVGALNSPSGSPVSSTAHYDKCVINLREQFKPDMTQVLDCIFSHSQVAKKNQLVTMLIVRWSGVGRARGWSPSSSSLSFLVLIISPPLPTPLSVLSWNQGPTQVRQVLCHKATSPAWSPTIF